ncbi:MAG: helix-turn-helix domain-containing protein [Gammaproteobacteria bacterium]|nr:helix-turn-helix domain-containing protein [Gammaproteobacteria bacterium]
MDLISTPEELEVMLGESVKALRLQKNLDRKTLCQQAGISENALRHLEGGQGTTVKTLVRVIKALDRESWLTGIAPEVSINPLHMVREKYPRQRASRRTYGKKEKI